MESFFKWLGVIASIATLVSLALYFYERHKLQIQSNLVLGFLHGIKSTIQGMAQAGNEWKSKVDKKDEKMEGYSIGYGNASTYNWLTLLEQVNDMIAKLSPPKSKKGS